MDLLALDVSWLIGHWIWPILQFLLGLGFVVFIHELGHFAVAKFVGIKVERFAIGMGPRLFGVVRGDTDYCLCALPLGGYVKMLGQEDFAPLEEGEDDEEGRPQVDPRSYQAKSVGARFAVISAGVIMNIIGAALLFVIVGLAGIEFTAPVVGNVLPDSAASEAMIEWDQPLPAETADGESRKSTKGIEPGDEFVRFDGDEIYRFQDLQVAAALADPEDTFEARIRRPLGDGKTVMGTALLGLKSGLSPSGGQILRFGLAPASSLEFIDPDDTKMLSLVEPKDRIVSLGLEKIEHSWQIYRWQKDLIPAGKALRTDGTFDPGQLPGPLAELQDNPKAMEILKRYASAGSEALPARVPLGVERNNELVLVEVPLSLFTGREKAEVVFLKTSGEMLLVEPDKQTEKDDQTILSLVDGSERTVLPKDIIKPKSGLDILGMSPRVEIFGVMSGSPADEAGLQPGDIIIRYGDVDLPVLGELREINKQFKDVETRIAVQRDGKDQAPVPITPTSKGSAVLMGISPGLDIAHAVVSKVRPGSPAAVAGIQSDDRIVSINGQSVSGWVDVYNIVRKAVEQDQSIAVTVARAGRTLDPLAIASADASMFQAQAYTAEISTRLLPRDQLLGEPVQHSNPLAAIAWGTREVGGFEMQTYATIRSLLVGTVSTKEAMGPVGIGAMAVETSRVSLVRFIYFMAIISVSLAVINFLPFPVVDGGHAVFLLIEKVRGKPVPVKIQNVVQIIGLVLILGFFLYVTWQDITRLVGNLW
ncbi:MAG: RIP metalloprotease RseP [Planctomycetota bacterium]